MLQAVQQLGSWKAPQLDKAAPGLRPLLSGMLQACALSSQRDKLPQVCQAAGSSQCTCNASVTRTVCSFVLKRYLQPSLCVLHTKRAAPTLPLRRPLQVLLRACSCLPPGHGHRCFEALLECAWGSDDAPSASGWLEPGEAAAALELLARFAHSKGLAGLWAQSLEDAAGLSPLAGLWTAALSLQAEAGTGARSSGEALAAATACLERLATSSEGGAGGANAKQSKAPRGAGGKAALASAANGMGCIGDGCGDAEAARLWALQLALAGASQLQQSVGVAAEEGDWAGGCGVKRNSCG